MHNTYKCTIPLGIVLQDLGRVGLNEQVPKVWKKCNCDYLVWNVFKITKSKRTNYDTTIVTNNIYIP